jgi:hypothetical protein
MATVTPNFNWPVPTSTDLVKDGATAIEALGDSIDASLVDLKGGTTGQVLSKNSNTDMDFVWVTDAAGDITGVTAGTGISGGGTSGTVTVTNSMATAIDAKGDLVPGTGADTFARLAVGANGTVLTADSAETTGLKWAAAASGNITLTQIASGTLSGANLTISGLTQDTIVVQINNPTWSSTNANVYCRLNGDATAKYVNSIAEQNGSTTEYDVATATASYDVFSGNRQFFGNGTGFMNYFLVLTNCKAAGKTQMYSKAIYLNTSSAKAFSINNGVYTADAQITSFTWLSGYTLTGGTYTVWGG